MKLQIVFYTIVLTLSSCISANRLSKLCSDKFIIKDSIIYIDRYDTIYEAIPNDTIIDLITRTDTINQYFERKRIKYINKVKDKIVYRENTGLVYQLKSQNDKISNKNKELEMELKFYKKLRNILIGIILFTISFQIILKTITKKWL